MESTLDRVLGSVPVTRAASWATAGMLRVPAYHGVHDPVAFRRQLTHVLRGRRLVSGAEVAAALHGGRPLPSHAAWVTFDDGCVDVVDAGLEVLSDLGVPATMFVCPGLIQEQRPFWWDQVLAALSEAPVRFRGRDWRDRSLVTELKGVDDAERRAVVAELEARTGASNALAARVLTVDHLRSWVDAGHEIGNHTWDHPCLDQCSEAEQANQIVSAHDWLSGTLGRRPDLFAYPNGDWSAAAERTIAALGYRLALLFDHRLARPSTANPLRVSRLRLDSDASPSRAAAIFSGAHSGMFRARARASTLAGNHA